MLARLTTDYQIRLWADDRYHVTLLTAIGAVALPRTFARWEEARAYLAAYW